MKMFLLLSLSAGHWVSPSVTGQPPQPCSRFTVTSLSGNRAVMFGGSKGWKFSNQMLIVKLVGESVVCHIYKLIYASWHCAQ